MHEVTALAPAPPPNERVPHVVVVGGGFGGLAAVQGLREAPVAITLIDRTNHHLFQPLLYQVATGSLSPANVAQPLRGLLRSQPNVRVLLAEVESIDVEARRVVLEGRRLPYDMLVVATGAQHDYFGKDWGRLAPGLKTIGDATDIRRRILGAFEAAELLGDEREAEAAGLLTFVVVGGGPTGVELAGALAEIARHTLRDEFDSIDPTRARILLVEGAPNLLGTYPRSLADRARRALERLGVIVRTGALVTDVRDDGVTIEQDGRREDVATRTVLWAAGVRASSLGRRIGEQTGAALDRAGRVTVGPDLTVAGHPEIFVIGDLAQAAGPGGEPLPGLAAVALQQGRYVAEVISCRLAGKSVRPFRYRNRGTMAVVGRGFAIADLDRVRLWGLPGWIVWALLHLAQLVAFENRVLVLTQWVWNYWTRNRAARLIVGRPPFWPPFGRGDRAD